MRRLGQISLLPLLCFQWPMADAHNIWVFIILIAGVILPAMTVVTTYALAETERGHLSSAMTFISATFNYPPGTPSRSSSAQLLYIYIYYIYNNNSNICFEEEWPGGGRKNEGRDRRASSSSSSTFPLPLRHFPFSSAALIGTCP